MFISKEQGLVTERFIIPYINRHYKIDSNIAVAEFGCGEAGNLIPFLNLGCRVTGIDILSARIERALEFYANHPYKDNLTLIASDIFKIEPQQIGTFELIIIRDTLEHVKMKVDFLSHIKKFLKPNGRIFIGFPPWQMPFGGHQQMCRNMFLSKIPYFHLLPKTLFIMILKLFKEEQHRISELIEIRNTRISIREFKKIVAASNLKIECEDFYLINPSYEIKFNLKSRKLPIFLHIPYLCNFYTTACFYILS